MSRIDSLIIKFAPLSDQAATLYGITFQNSDITVDNTALIRVQGMTLLSADPPPLQFDAAPAEAEYAVPQEVFGDVYARVNFDDASNVGVDVTVVAVVYGAVYELGRAVLSSGHGPMLLDWSAVPATPPEPGRFWTNLNHNLTYEVP